MKMFVCFLDSAEMTPDLSVQKTSVDVSQVDEYHISCSDDHIENIYSSQVLATTLPQCLEENLSFDIEVRCLSTFKPMTISAGNIEPIFYVVFCVLKVMKGNSREWEKIATGLSSPFYAWSDVNPLLPYAFRIVGRNQFGIGQPSRTTHVEPQVGKFSTKSRAGNHVEKVLEGAIVCVSVIPDLSYVVPTVREATGVLEGREPPELRWQTPRVYSLSQTLTPFSYEVQVRAVGARESSNEWKVFRANVKQPHCSLEGLDPEKEYALRVVAVTNFGRGEPSQSARKRKERDCKFF